MEKEIGCMYGLNEEKGKEGNDVFIMCMQYYYLYSLFILLELPFFVFPSGYLPTFIGGVKKFFMKDSPFSVSSK